MKKILFVIGSMNHGGTESQLINLMKSLDTNKFDISIFIMEAKGPLLKDLNSIEINKKYFGGFRSHKNRLISYFRFFRTVFYLFKIMLFNRYHLVQSYLPLTNFLTSFLGIFTLLSGLNIYLASFHQITSVLLVFSALNLYYLRTK